MLVSNWTLAFYLFVFFSDMIMLSTAVGKDVARIKNGLEQHILCCLEIDTSQYKLKRDSQ